jgi:hypothetical protein
MENWRRQDDVELRDLCSSPNIKVIKWRTMRWAGHMARTGEEKNSKCVINDGFSCWDYTASVVEKWMSMQRWWNGTARRKPKYSDKNLYQHQFTTKPIWSGLGLNLGFRYERPTTYCLSNGTVLRRGMHAGFWGKTEINRLLGKPRRRLLLR